MDYRPAGGSSVWILRGLILLGASLAGKQTVAIFGLGQHAHPAGTANVLLLVVWWALILAALLRVVCRVRTTDQHVEFSTPGGRWAFDRQDVAWVRGWVLTPVWAWHRGLLVVRLKGSSWRLPYYLLTAPWLAWTRASAERNATFAELAQWLRSPGQPAAAAPSPQELPTGRKPRPGNSGHGLSTVYYCSRRQLAWRWAGLAGAVLLWAVVLLHGALTTYDDTATRVLAGLFLSAWLSLVLYGTLTRAVSVTLGEDLRVRTALGERHVRLEDVLSVEVVAPSSWSWIGPSTGAPQLRIRYTNPRGHPRSMLISADFDTPRLVTDLRLRGLEPRRAG